MSTWTAISRSLQGGPAVSDDPRYFTLGYRVNSGFAISALSASDILALRYKEPGTTLGPEE